MSPFQFWHFPPIFVLFKVTCLVTLFDHKLQVFKNWPKLTIFDIFNELLSAQNVYLARFARNVKCDFLGDFQASTVYSLHLSSLHKGLKKHNKAEGASKANLQATKPNLCNQSFCSNTHIIPKSKLFSASFN